MGRAIKKRRAKLAEYPRWFASRGGKARAQALTAKEWKTIGRQVAEARWRRRRNVLLPEENPTCSTTKPFRPSNQPLLHPLLRPLRQPSQQQ